MLTVSVLSASFVILLNDSRTKVYYPSARPVVLMVTSVEVGPLERVTKDRTAPVI